MIQVLIVDDDRDIREIVRREVQEQGWAALEADSEAELGTVLKEDTPDILEIGADDHVVKPFNPRKLVACIKAVLRRTSGREMGASPSESLGHDCRRFAGWLLDLTARLLTDLGGKVVTLTNAEFFCSRPS